MCKYFHLNFSNFENLIRNANGVTLIVIIIVVVVWLGVVVVVVVATAIVNIKTAIQTNNISNMLITCPYKTLLLAKHTRIHQQGSTSNGMDITEWKETGGRNGKFNLLVSCNHTSAPIVRR